MVKELWHKVDSQFIRFIFVGVLNTAFENIIVL